MAKVKEIIGAIHKVANPQLAMGWDNVGLQVGDAEKEVNKVLLTLDVTENAVEKAIKIKAELIIAHHPLIFKPIKNITNPLYLKLIKNDVAVFSAHTNMDVAKEGVNYALAEKLGLRDLQFISSETGAELYQVAVFVPRTKMTEVADAAFAAGAGKIGNYQNCIHDYDVSGQFKPLAGSNPNLGEVGKLHKTVERKLEFFVESFHLNPVIKAIKKAHPYETPVYAVYKQQRQSDNFGLGLIGNLSQPISLEALAAEVKEKLGCKYVKLWLAGQESAGKVEKIAVCGGSGSSLLAAVQNRAQVFISADFTYHTMLDSPMPLIDAGHFYTEYPVLEKFENILQQFSLKIEHLLPQEHEIKNEVVVV